MSSVESQETHEEQQYLEICRDIITKGTLRTNERTGTGTLATFGTRMEFDLSGGILPLLTTKRMGYKTVLKELLWFISGSTDNKVLQAQGVHIWDGNTTAEFLRGRKLPYREGDIGAGYGHQWRHAGADYKGCDADYKGQGVDQLAEAIRLIKEEPQSRRIIIQSWNVSQLPQMTLPPCHLMVQFFVDGDFLSCQMYQRSADMGLGVPFNIASYAMLLHMVAYVTGLKAGKFIHVLGDTHVYLNHVEPLQEQLKNKPFPFPTLEIDPKAPRDIDQLRLEHFTVKGYKSHDKIAMKMAI